MTNDDMESVPFVDSFDGGPWVEAERLSNRLEEQFPSQDAYNFTMACYYNAGALPAGFDPGTITSLVLVQQGEREGAYWIWRGTSGDGRDFQVWAWCDFTGWDCQSGITIWRDDEPAL